MLDIKYILNNLEKVKYKTEARNYNYDFDELMILEQKRKDNINQVEQLKKCRNELSKEVGILKQKGQDTQSLQDEVKKGALDIQLLDSKVNDIEAKLLDILLNIPNLIDDSTPLGNDEKDNVEERRWAEQTKFSFEPKAHWDLGIDLDILDFERGVKIAKSRFSVIKGIGAKLDRALSSYMLDTHGKSGYIEVNVPIMVNTRSMTGTGQLPKFQEEVFYCEKDELYLIPTAEVPVTNLYSNEILESKDLTIKHVSLTPCFRREAGSYGKDVRGLIRQHQFNKVELVKICKIEESVNEHELLTKDAENILQQLKLPYRVISLCSGDLGFSSAKTYDLEVWLPAQNCYREISSCSNFKDFQSRRANIRYRDSNGKIQFAHTINGSGLAVGRTLVAIIENYQQPDGSIVVPEVLRPYLNGMDIIRKDD